MPHKKIFSLYTVEERLDAWEDPGERVIGVFTSKVQAIAAVEKRHQECKARQHRVTKFHSANWFEGETYEEFYNKVWGNNYLYLEVLESPESNSIVLMDWQEER